MVQALRGLWSDESGSFVENLVWITVAALGTTAVAFGLVGAFRAKGGAIVADLTNMETVGEVVDSSTTGTLTHDGNASKTGATVKVSGD